MNASFLKNCFHLFAMPFYISKIFFYLQFPLLHPYLTPFAALALPYPIKLTGAEAAHAVSDSSCLLSQ